MTIITKYLFLVVIQSIFIFGQVPQSPCPSIFLYKYENGMWFGDITLYIDSSVLNIGHIQITVHLIINERLSSNEDYPVQLEHDAKNAYDKIKEGKPLRIKLPFISYYKIPILLDITVNGNIKCLSNFDVKELVPKTSIHRTLTLKWHVPQPELEFSNKVSPPFQHVQKSSSSFPVTNTPQPFYPDSQPQPSVAKCGVASSQNPNPWLVGLIKNQYLYCTGILISSMHVITAARCTENVPQITINLGTNDLTLIYIARYKSVVYPHVDYDPSNRYSDLSIILMNEEVSFSPNIKPICLWPKEHNQISTGRTLKFIGWQAKGSLIEKNIVVTDLGECNKFQSNFVLDNMICTSDNSQVLNGCIEIIGGFLIDFLDNKMTLRGIFTASNFDLNSARCNSDSHCIFTDIVDFHDWIKLYMRIQQNA